MAHSLGVAGELRGKVGVNALWPRTAIDTAAMAEFKNNANVGALRSPEIMADAAHIILTSKAAETTGNFFIDDELLAAHGLTDLSRYAAEGVAEADLTPDLFVPSLHDISRRPETGNVSGGTSPKNC